MLINFMPNILNRFKNIALERKYKLGLPTNPSLEDIFLVSYPKSGNTWLRFLIANAIKNKYKIQRNVNFFSIEDIIPGMKGSRNIRPEGPFGRIDLPRIIKSHSAYNPHYHRVILLVRDPRDVMVSYYHYLKGFGRIDADQITLSQFIQDKKRGVHAWCQHTNSWFFPVKRGQRIKVFLYEKILKDTQEQLREIMDLIGIDVEEDDLQKAINASSIDNMRNSELRHKSTYLIQKQESIFVRKAQASGGQELETQDRKFIEKTTKDIAQILGYYY